MSFAELCELAELLKVAEKNGIDHNALKFWEEMTDPLTFSQKIKGVLHTFRTLKKRSNSEHALWLTELQSRHCLAG